MTTTVPISDWELNQLRQLGLLVCRCAIPKPVYLAEWCAYECGRCRKKMVKPWS